MIARGSVKAGELLLRRAEADGEAFNLAMPSVGLGFVDPFREVAHDLDQTLPLARVNPQHRATDAGVLVDARCAVGPPAVSEFDLSEVEVLLEFSPLGLGRLAVLLAGTHGSAPVNEAAVVADEVILEDGRVGLRGVDVRVAEDLRRDVDGQATSNGLGGEHAPKVVGRVAQRPAGCVGDAGAGHRACEQVSDQLGVKDIRSPTVAVSEAVAVLEEVRKFGTVLSGSRIRLTIAARTLANSGVTSNSRSSFVLDGMICSSGTSSPVSAIRWETMASWVSSSSSSMRIPVWRSVSMTAHAQNASSSAIVTLVRAPSARSSTRMWDGRWLPALGRSPGPIRRYVTPACSTVAPTAVRLAASRNPARSFFHCSAVSTKRGRLGSRSRVR